MHVTVTSPSWSTAAAETLAPIARATRWTNSLAAAASADSPVAEVEASTSAMTWAGVYPTPSRPRSPSVTTSNRTLSRSRLATSCSSSRSAAHFASPTVSPVASTRTTVGLAHRFGLPPRFRLTFRGGPERDWPCAAPAIRSGGFGRRGRVAARSPARALGRNLRLRHQPAGDDALAGRPEVRRQPVDHEPRREI